MDLKTRIMIVVAGIAGAATAILWGATYTALTS